MKGFFSLCKCVGIHPLVGLSMIAVDAMMFGTNLVTVGVGLPFTTIVAVLLGIPCALIQ